MSMEQKLNEARQRVLNGQQLTLEEQKELLDAIRQGRFTAAEAGAKSRTKKTSAKQAKEGMSDEDLDASLGDLGL